MRTLSTAAPRLIAPCRMASQRTLLTPGLRSFASSPLGRNTPPPSPSSSPSPPAAAAFDGEQPLATYSGPLANTFTRLKLFSLGSLGLASILTPVLLLAPGEISMAGRVGLSITALATSGVSTALIAWIGTPYVGSMRLLPTSTSTSASATSPSPKNMALELNTVSWRLKPQRTIVYEPTFLRPTSRPFAAWEITNSPPPLEVPTTQPEEGEGEVMRKVAETFDVKSAKSLGCWMIKYNTQAKTKGQDGVWRTQGKVHVEGKPTRYFNVHEELLGEDWQVLG